MRIAVVIGTVTSSDKHECYEARKLLLVQRVTVDRMAMGIPTAAIDYVGAGPGVRAVAGLGVRVINIHAGGGPEMLRQARAARDEAAGSDGPKLIGVIAALRSNSSVSSKGTTASAPSGIGAPVIMRIAVPDTTVSVGRCPAAT